MKIDNMIWCPSYEFLLRGWRIDLIIGSFVLVCMLIFMVMVHKDIKKM